MERLFLAVPVTLFEYEKIQEDFSEVISGRWVPSENLHLTLYYFGDSFKKEELVSKLSSSMSKINPSQIIGLNFFRHNNILYAETKNRSLENLYFHLCEALSLASEQTFIQHITLIRMKKIYDHQGFRQKIADYDNKVIGKIIPKVQLIQSHLDSGGARYELIREFQI